MNRNPSHPWFRDKTYTHFDTPLGVKKAEQYAAYFQKKPTHDFYPFITYDLVMRKVIRVPKSERKKAKHSLRFKPKNRPLAYAAHRDRIIFSYYSHMLGISYENYLNNCDFSDSITAFRKLGKNNIHFSKAVFEEVKLHNDCFVLAMDVKSFFNNLDHKIIKSKWKEVLGLDDLPDDHYQVFKAITKFSVVEKKLVYKTLGISMHNTPEDLYKLCDNKVFRTKIRPLINIDGDARKRTKGIPQGSPISALLSNIYMLDFDSRAYKLAQTLNGKYYRYCDDILFILPNITADEAKIYEETIEEYIADIKLELNPDKTEVFHLNGGAIVNQNKPLQYLGFIFDGRDILLRSSGIQNCHIKIRKSVKLAYKTRKKRVKLGLAHKNLYKKKLYNRYSYNGNRNYISYALRSAETMESTKIKKQIKPIWAFLNNEIKTKDEVNNMVFHKASYSIHLVYMKPIHPMQCRYFRLCQSRNPY